MSAIPTLLFLHGVGKGDPHNVWQTRLDQSLRRIGYPGLAGVEINAPKYVHALRGVDDQESVPPTTVRRPQRDEAKRNRRDFERRMGALELRLGQHNGGGGGPVEDFLVDATFAVKFFRQANNYITNSHIRARVLNRILETLPSSGPLVIIGHSLGSVIAADLVPRLPVGVDVVGMVTIGSPLANGNFDVDKLSDTLKEPPTNLAWWANFWSPSDPVTARRGASSTFPWIIDLRTHTPAGIHAHDAVEYLSDDTVGTAVGFALHGSLTKEIARAESSLEVPLDVPELLALLALRYATLVRSHLEGDLLDRYSGALRRVQATTIHDLVERDREAGRTTPSSIARLAFDLADPRAVVPESLPASHIPKDAAVLFLAVLATENVILPFEIDIPTQKRKAAMQELSSEMGLGNRFGADVFQAARTARDVLSDKKVNLLKLGMLGAGAVAIVVATGGLALAAGAGLAGAAAVTSALAAFGPGGMIGGLVTAGTLVGAGGGGLAFGLASPTVSAAAMESVVERQLIVVILRQLQHLDQDPSVWRNFVAIEGEARRQHERLDEFSDSNAPALKELKRKITAVERALAYMDTNKLSPVSARTDREETEWTD